MNRIAIKQYLIKGGAWAFAGKILSIFVGMALSSLLARLLSPKDMGAYFLAFNLANFFSIFSRMGIDHTLQRFVAKELACNQPHIACTVIRTALTLTLANTLLVAASTYFFLGPWINKNILTSDRLGNSIGFISGWLVLLTFQYIFTSIFQAAQNVRMAVLVNGLLPSTITTFFIIFYLVTKGHATLDQIFPWVLTAGGINILLALSMLIKERNKSVTPKNNIIGFLKFTSHSWPLFIYTLMMFIRGESCLWIISNFRSDAEVAVYGAVLRLVLLTNMSITIVNTIIPPLIVRLHADKKRLEQLLRSTATISALPALAVLSIYILFGDWILEVIFGEYYRVGKILLMVMTLGQAVNVLGGSCGYVLIMLGHHYSIMLISITSSIIALGGSLLLVNSYGCTGVAICYAVAIVIQQLIMLVFVRYRCGIWTHAGIRYLYSGIKLLLWKQQHVNSEDLKTYH